MYNCITLIYRVLVLGWVFLGFISSFILSYFSELWFIRVFIRELFVWFNCYWTTRGQLRRNQPVGWFSWKFQKSDVPLGSSTGRGWINEKSTPKSHLKYCLHMGVSKNRGNPQIIHFNDFSIINHPFWGTPIFGNTHISNFCTLTFKFYGY